MKQLIFSLVLLFSTVILTAQNVGINTNIPTEDLHIRSSETKAAIRIDSKKSVENGVNYFTAIGTPTSVSNFEMVRKDNTIRAYFPKRKCVIQIYLLNAPNHVFRTDPSIKFLAR